MNQFLLAIIGSILLLAAGCGSTSPQTESMNTPKTNANPPSKPAQVFNVKVTGTVRDEPEGAVLSNVLVYISKVPGKYNYTPPKEPVRIAHINNEYVPRVIALQTGQPLRLENKDESGIHNDHVPLPYGVGQHHTYPRTVILNEPNVFVLGCDVHKTEKALVGVFDHPFFCITNEKGEFEFPEHLQPGDYEISVTGERMQTIVKPVRLKKLIEVVDIDIHALKEK